ncbi:MAG: methylated-DNA--[protein]-cysteine S-methyltransferase [Thermanaeromonas sp.]|uniref:methylated-DNA--[protein]-cysteine S-methyltransferase n=1 Tax=Thermanaeromonas sp. TaxID=2003697 RepID=UPI00244007FF|nr:methylated-DNA--[protein]-cysteine S-methyltransferase [Thermanaeromonas sp.]MCG0278904.1 methylated-DNA--[protein]-cysteine S-methyltransferase [Thermanaeromonas sp.]
MSSATSLTLYWEKIPSPLGHLMAVFSPSGLCRLAFPNEPLENVIASLNSIFPQATIKEKPGVAKELAQQLQEYFLCRRKSFDIPLDLRGTPFQLLVWKALAQVPYGTTKTYGELAKAIGRPKASRAVGRAVGSNPVGIIIPCHRIIGARGDLRGFGGGLDIKEKLLILEGALLKNRSLY